MIKKARIEDSCGHIITSIRSSSDDGYLQLASLLEIFDAIKESSGDPEWDSLLLALSGVNTADHFYDEVRVARMILEASPVKYCIESLVIISFLFYGLKIPIIATRHSASSTEAHVLVFLCDIIFTIVYVADILLKLNTAVLMNGKLLSRSTGSKQYIFSVRFAVDLVGTIPFDVVFQLINANKEMIFTSPLRLLRIFWIKNLFKFCGTGIVKPRDIKLSYRYVPMIRLSLTCILFVHCMACCFFVVSCEVNCGYDMPTSKQYRTSLYWVLYTLSSVGYGDVVVPTDAAKILSMILFIITIIVNSWLVGKMTSAMVILDTAGEQREMMRRTLQVVNHFGMPSEVVEDILSLQNHLLGEKMHLNSFIDIVGMLPEPLQHTLSLYFRVHHLNMIDLFQGISGPSKVAIANSLEREVRGRGDYITFQDDESTEMYFLVHGLCEVRCNDVYIATLMKGAIFGECGIAFAGQRTSSVRCLTYCELMVLRKESITAIKNQYPDVATHLEKNAADIRSIASTRAMSDDVGSPRTLNRLMHEFNCLEAESRAIDEVVLAGEVRPSLSTQNDKAVEKDIQRELCKTQQCLNANVTLLLSKLENQSVNSPVSQPML